MKVILADELPAAQADERGEFDIALNALQRYQDGWDTGLPSEYAQSERIQMECACEAVREALQEARAAIAQPQAAEPNGLSDYRKALRDTLLALQYADCSELFPELEGKVRAARTLLAKGE